MGSFERQLIDAKDAVVRAQREFEEAKREADMERQRLAKIASEQSTKRAIERASRLVDHLIPMVDEVMAGVGNQTWGKGKYKKYFVSIGAVRGDHCYIEEKYPSRLFEEMLADWTIWCEGEKICYLNVRLYGLQDAVMYFAVNQRDQEGMRITNSTNREELEQLMTEEFLLGPKVYYPPRFDYPVHG